MSRPLIILLLLSLTICEDHECEKKTGILLNHIITKKPLPPEYEHLNKLGLYSGSGVNELGDYGNCKGLEFANYYILSITEPLPIKLGICYFKECDIKYINNAKANICNLINTQFNMKIDPEKLVIGDSSINLQIVQDKNWTGMIIVTSILSVLIMINIFVPQLLNVMLPVLIV